eukprot:1454244-Rhodomonas_salina.4
MKETATRTSTRSSWRDSKRRSAPETTKNSGKSSPPAREGVGWGQDGRVAGSLCPSLQIFVACPMLYRPRPSSPKCP